MAHHPKYIHARINREIQKDSLIWDLKFKIVFHFFYASAQQSSAWKRLMTMMRMLMIMSTMMINMMTMVMICQESWLRWWWWWWLLLCLATQVKELQAIVETLQHCHWMVVHPIRNLVIRMMIMIMMMINKMLMKTMMMLKHCSTAIESNGSPSNP